MGYTMPLLDQCLVRVFSTQGILFSMPHYSRSPFGLPHGVSQAHAFTGIAKRAHGRKPSQDVIDGLLELERHLVNGARFMAAYCGRGFLMRFIASSSDQAHFQDLDKKLQRAMQVGGHVTTRGNWQKVAV
jgi:hypothetical protein